MRRTTTLLLFAIATNLSFGFAQPAAEHLMKGLQYRNIGPANQGGRITDIEADRDDFTKVYIAVASGGVWKSVNAGTSWTPIFDNYETASIGDIALDPQDSETIWVGTGEANNRNSVSWGHGVYVSKDGGTSFVHKGLESTHQIARVLVHPDDPDDVCVCAIGHLWGYSGERGLFHTTDGGATWQKMTNGLPDDGKTGCTDLVRDPNDPNTLYAAFYHRLRKPWHFHSGGGEGGIYKSTNGGKSWRKLAGGLPEGPTGRIGLAIYESDPDILMALVEAEQTDTLAVPGSGVYRTENGGRSWSYVNTYNNRPFYYSQIRINPLDDQRVYLLTTRFMVSEDGGKTLRNGSEDEEVHGDFHAMWLDPQHKDRYYLGADKGLSITHDHGEHFTLIDNLPIAQFYRINYGWRDPYYVYGGLQDNGSYATASFSRDARGILSDANWKMHWGDGQDVAQNPMDWTDMYSSTENDGFTKYNPRTREIHSITPSPFNTHNWSDHLPSLEEDDSALRYNWSAPLILSTHDHSTIYIGGNHVFRSADKGQSWTIISPDLSTDHPVKRKQGVSGGITPDNTGAETHCSITALAQSELDAGLLWAGTDDGNVQVTRDGGGSWTNVRGNVPLVPDSLWVSRIEPSRFARERAYLSFDGHRSDHLGTWLFVTEDAGASWRRITNGFAEGEVVRVVREDPINENLLFAGTETGVWCTLDRGATWQRLRLNMPTVSIYDLRIHPRDHDLIVGTHGRSLWILDDISPLQQWRPELADKPAHLFVQKTATDWENVSRGGQRGHFWFAGDNPPSIDLTSSRARARFRNLAAITYFVGEGQTDSLELTIRSPDGQHERRVHLAPEPGLHRYYWDRIFDAPAFTAGDQKELDDFWATARANFEARRVDSAYEDFQQASTPLEKRRELESLKSRYPNLPLPASLRLPTAGVGSYRLELRAGDHVERATLRIREDPMK